MDCIITIEIGTSSVKVYGFDLNGRVIAHRKGIYPTFHPHPDYSEQDPEQIFITVLFVLKSFLNEHIHTKNHKVVALCFSASMHSVLAVDDKGIALGNAIIWADNRAIKEAESLKKTDLGSQIYHATGTPIHPMSPLAKIKWIKNNEPDKFTKTQRFLSIKTYIIQQLTGQYVVDYSMASATGLFNIHQLKWNQDSLDYLGITSDKIPTVVPVFFDELSLKKEICVSLGLLPKTKVIIGGSDGCFATLGAGVVGEGNATISITSSGAVRVAGKEVLKDEKQRFFNYLIDKDFYISGGPTNNAGVVFEWFARQFGDFSNVLDFEDAVNDLFKDASQVAAGANGLIFLPYLFGERAPLWNANARGMYFGLNISHEQKHFIRATIEGILFEIYSIGKLLESYRRIDTLYVNGTFAALPLWASILADMYGKTVYVNDNHDSASVGAALVGLTQLGVFKNVEEASKIIQSSQVYQPNQQNHSVYMKYFEIFESLSYKLNAEFDAIAALQHS
ncbi:MAG: gluconokinase [Spirosomaceae bacterium]|nr:gluconokinase [Spirosomataceae bacterium]